MRSLNAVSLKALTLAYANHGQVPIIVSMSGVIMPHPARKSAN